MIKKTNLLKNNICVHESLNKTPTKVRIRNIKIYVKRVYINNITLFSYEMRLIRLRLTATEQHKKCKRINAKRTRSLGDAINEKCKTN